MTPFVEKVVYAAQTMVYRGLFVLATWYTEACLYYSSHQYCTEQITDDTLPVLFLHGTEQSVHYYRTTVVALYY